MYRYAVMSEGEFSKGKFITDKNPYRESSYGSLDEAKLLKDRQQAEDYKDEHFGKEEHVVRVKIVIVKHYK